jgi:hypothetical protein
MMRLPTLVQTLAALASFATIASADSFEINVYSTTPDYPKWGYWTTCCGSYYILARDGCQYNNPDGTTVGVPGMNTLCMDWTNLRGHFYFDGQGKRCIAQNSETHSPSGMITVIWFEVLCTW